MSDPGRTERVYALAARTVLGRRLDPVMVEEMALVFGELWRAEAEPRSRLRLVAREAVGLWRTRRRLERRTGAGRGRRDDWNGRDRMGELARDIRVGLRVLWKSPAASLAAIVTLALGIGGTTAVFTVAQGVLFDPMSFPDADELVLLLEESPDGQLNLTSRDNFVDVREAAQTLDAVGLYRGNSVSVTGLGEPERIRGEFVTASYFDVLGVEPVLGRAIQPGEDVEGGDRTAVLSHGYWVRRFASDPGVLGRSVNLNSLAHTIVGVMPEGFRSYWDATEAWISLHTAPGDLASRGSRGFFAIARLAEGVDRETAESETDGIMARLAEAYPESNAGYGTRMLGLAEYVVGEQRSTLVWSLLGAIGLVLLIATANVANLQLARAIQRSREMAIRSALGGGRRRLLAQLLVENLTLAALGGLAGVAVAVLALRLLLTASFSPFASFDIAVDQAALAAATLLTVGVGTLAGIVPAVRGSMTAPAGQLREDGRSGTAGRSSARFRSALVVGQMAMAVTLLIGASLLLRTTAALRGLDVGFDAGNLLTGETRLTAEAYEDAETRRTYLQQVVTALSAIPGTQGATLVAGMPFSGDGGSAPVRAEGSDLSFDEAPVAFVPIVAEGYFDVMDIPVVAGRTFSRTDDATNELVVVASRTLAERLYPDSDPIGRMIETPGGAGRIIGVVEDTRRSLTTEFQPTGYLHDLQQPPTLFSVLVRTEGPPATYRRAFQEAFWSVDANQPLWEIMALDERMATYSRNETFLSALLGGFAGLALLLSAVGMYGVMAHGVGRRRHELGIRLALGADRGRVLKMVLTQGVTLTVLGAVVGVAVGAAAARLLASVVFGVGVLDPVSFVVAPTVLVFVAILATWVPARRATRVDPVEAFRG